MPYSIVYATPRTGSTFIAHALKQNLTLDVDQEIFNKKQFYGKIVFDEFKFLAHGALNAKARQNPYAFVCNELLPSKQHLYIFKLFTLHVGLFKTLRLLRHSKNNFFIIRDPLACFVSDQKAAFIKRKTGKDSYQNISLDQVSPKYPFHRFALWTIYYLLHVFIIKVSCRHRFDVVIEYSSIESQPNVVFEQITERLVQTNEMISANCISTSDVPIKKQTTKNASDIDEIPYIYKLISASIYSFSKCFLNI